MFEEPQHSSHVKFARDGETLRMHDEGKSYSDIAASDHVTRSEAHRRANSARTRQWDYVGVGKSLDIRSIYYILENYRTAVLHSRDERGLRRIDIDPGALAARVKADIILDVRPRWVKLRTLAAWAENRLSQPIED